MLDHPFEINQIEESISEWKTAIRQASPSCVFLTDSIEVLDATKIGYFEFTSDADDGAVYNFIFIVATVDKPLFGSFNCPFTLYEDWKQLVVQIILSIQDTSVELGPCETEPKKIIREIKSTRK